MGGDYSHHDEDMNISEEEECPTTTLLETLMNLFITFGNILDERRTMAIDEGISNLQKIMDALPME